MTQDNDLKLTLKEVLSHAVKRMEAAKELNTRKCIFEEYREWLGPSIDDWVLALPNDFGRFDFLR